MLNLAQFFIILLVYTTCSAKESETAVYELRKIAATVKRCLSKPFPAVCLKERALEALNETLHLDEPIMFGYVRIEKNRDYNWNSTSNSDNLPNEISKRSIVLNDALLEKLQELFKSRTIKLNVDEAIEGRKKGDGGGGGGKGKGMMMMAAAAACVGAGMMIGKMGMMAMGALMLSKLSLIISAIMLLKKSKGGGDDKENKIKVVYVHETAGGGGGGGDWNGKGGGGGGWQRSQGSQPIVYEAQIPENVGNYEG